MARTTLITRVEGTSSIDKAGRIYLSIKNIEDLRLRFKCDSAVTAISDQWVKVTLETITLCPCGQEAQPSTDPPLCPDCCERKAGERPVGGKPDTEELATDYDKENRRHERKGG